MRVPLRVLYVLPLAIGRASADPMPAVTVPWSFHAAANVYVVAGGNDYVQPTGTADAGRVHLEARFNYEDRHAGSIWAGYNTDVGGEQVRLEFTPMLGVVFGNTSGIAPGYEASVSWRRFGLYSESEYVFDLDRPGDSFLYTWTELTVSPSERWRLGIVAQRTRAYEAARDIQRGLLLGCTLGRFEFTAYAFDPDVEPTWVVAVGAGF